MNFIIYKYILGIDILLPNTKFINGQRTKRFIIYEFIIYKYMYP
jgi:hypothetical protein